jgi:tRNA threonylcarbamoyladenosine biosynthesis protein TsaE
MATFYYIIVCMDITLKTLDETRAFASSLLSLAKALKQDKATVVALHGDLGAGKTTLTQFIAEALGVKEDVVSPTFVIQKSYETKDPEIKKLVHIDAYRIEKPEEFRTLRIEDTLRDPDSLVIVEWPKQGGEHFANPSLEVFLEVVDETTRKARIKSNGQSS